MSNKDERRLRELRKSLGYSVDEFARLLGIHRSSLYRYEADNKYARDLPISLALKLTEIFNISLDWLAGISDVKYLDDMPNKVLENFNKLSDEGKKEVFNFLMYTLSFYKYFYKNFPKNKKIPGINPGFTL